MVAVVATINLSSRSQSQVFRYRERLITFQRRQGMREGEGSQLTFSSLSIFGLVISYMEIQRVKIMVYKYKHNAWLYVRVLDVAFLVVQLQKRIEKERTETTEEMVAAASSLWSPSCYNWLALSFPLSPFSTNAKAVNHFTHDPAFNFLITVSVSHIFCICISTFH